MSFLSRVVFCLAFGIGARVFIGSWVYAAGCASEGCSDGCYRTDLLITDTAAYKTFSSEIATTGCATSVVMGTTQAPDTMIIVTQLYQRHM